MSIRLLTSGESHGVCLNAIIEGLPSGFKIDVDFINSELKRRTIGVGRGKRMQIESDKCIIKSGLRFGLTTGAPILLEIENLDHKNWQIEMSCYEIENSQENLKKIEEKRITKVRPGHADLAGILKYNHNDARNILERSSARDTAIRVAVGALCKCILKYFKIEIESEVININGVNYKDKDKINRLIEETRNIGDTLGGTFKIVAKNVIPGLGSCMSWDRKLDGKIAQGIVSIGAIKSVEFGLGNMCAYALGSKVHDEIYYDGGIKRKTNNAGGIEGGMSNGEDIIIVAAMKPIPTLKTPLSTIDFITKENIKAHFERSDVCAVESCAIVAENVVAYILLSEFLEKFSSDNIDDIKCNFENYKQRIDL